MGPGRRQDQALPEGLLRRGVPIPGWLAEILADMFDNQPGRDAATCGVEHARGGAKCRSALVLPVPWGGPLNGRSFRRRQWDTACLDASIELSHLHDLRHSYASWLVQDGIQLQEVQRLLGHASIVTT